MIDGAGANGDELIAYATGIEPMLSQKQVARILGVHPNTVARYVKNGDLKAIRLGYGRGRVVVQPSDLREYVRRHRA